MIRDLAVPVLIGIVAGLLVWAIPEPEPAAPFESTPDQPGVLYPFESGPRMDTARGHILVLADPETPANLTWFSDPNVDEVTGASSQQTAATRDVVWTGPVGLVPIANGSFACRLGTCGLPVAPWVAQEPLDSARFDAANETIRLTLYAFNAQGELVASNAPIRDADRFDLYGDFILLGDDAWYVGNGSVPAHASNLPFGSALAAAALDGLPVGGVATVHLAQHPFDWLVGELWLTGRVESFG